MAAAPEPPAAAEGTDRIELNTVSFEQLRAYGLSVTQATRLLAHRERVGRFHSVDELDQTVERRFAETFGRYRQAAQRAATSSSR